MRIDRFDLLTIFFGSMGFLVASMIGFALESDYIILYQVIGVVTGVSFVIFAVKSTKYKKGN